MKSLFDLPEEFRPAADRPDPSIWVRRLVIVPERTAGVEPIRDIEFRRGLNIIATAEPNERAAGVVGHNVGKTLLTRLIRYCLGEQQFARAPTRDAIARILPSGCAIAEIVVMGACWVVCRPMGQSRSRDSACIQGDEWRAILDDGSATRGISAFVDALEQATVKAFSHVLLPHQDRPGRWLDLLAWLSRDQYCRYRHPLQWRAAWAESGTAELHDEDASVLIRLTMDLLDQHEANLIQRHKQLLSELTTKRAEVKRSEEQLARTRQFLQERLQMDDDLLAADLFGEAAHERIRGARRETQETIEGLAATSGLAALEEELAAAKESVAKKEQEVDTREADRQAAEGELKSHQAASDDSLIASYADLAHPCPLPADQCPLKDPTIEPGQRDPRREVLARRATIEIQRLDQQLAKLKADLARLRKECQSVQHRRDEKQKQVVSRRETLGITLRQLDALLVEAKQYKIQLQEQSTAVADLAKLERQVEESRHAHHVAHEQIAHKQRRLDQHLNRVLYLLTLSDIQGQTEIDMRGLRLIVDGRDFAPGEALTSEIALAFDLACLSASISGLGSLPRFLIHDSPREADLESHIYARLFTLILEMEHASAGRDPSFQYIVTTTTPPPAEVAASPYVRLRLDARRESDLLMHKRF